jgi:TPR repeat protein
MMKQARAVTLVFVLLGCAAPVLAQQTATPPAAQPTTAPPSPDFADIARDLNARDFDSAVPKLRALVDQGDPRAMTALAEMLLNGVGMPKDPDAGFALVTRAAQAGDLLGMADLASCFINAVGTSRDLDQGRLWARKAAAAGIDLGQVLIYVAYLLDPANAFIEDGKPNQARYDALGRRTLEERKDQIEAIDMLGRAADQGNAQAEFLLFNLYSDNVGNSARALLTARKLPPALLNSMRNNLEALLQLQAVGATMTTLQLFADTRQIAFPIVLSGLPGCTTAQIVGVVVRAPVRNAAYLPSSVPTVQNVVLLSGEWDEQWTFDACGSMMDALVTFTADGMGGAYVRARLLQ